VPSNTTPTWGLFSKLAGVTVWRSHGIRPKYHSVQNHSGAPGCAFSGSAKDLHRPEAFAGRFADHLSREA
jgi:hypothetical protein